MMKHNEFDEGVMIEVVHLLMILFLFHQVCHLLNVSEQEILDVQHPHPSEMHEKLDMICVQYGESALTSEVSHGNLHHR